MAEKFLQEWMCDGRIQFAHSRHSEFEIYSNQAYFLTINGFFTNRSALSASRYTIFSDFYPSNFIKINS